MRKLLILILFIASVAKAQISPFAFGGGGQYALDFDGSTEYLSCTPALRLTGEYSLYDNFSDGNYDGWTVSSGAYSVVDSVPLSGGTKSLKCTTAGIISIPCNQAYGQWEFDININGNVAIAFITDFTNTTSSNSDYFFQVGAANKNIKLTKVGVADIMASSTNYITVATWYRIKITRNTNGQFHIYIKGGAFGSDYVLVSVTGGSGTNPVTDNAYTTSNYLFLSFGVNDMISNIVCQQGEGSLDLNSYERIYHSDNRAFTKTGGLAWTGNGTHSIDTTSTDKRTGTYSGKLISTDAGDSTTNFINLPSVNFDTLKTDVNGVYEKYTLEFWVKSKGASGLPRINVRIGNQLKQSDTISNIAFEKFVFNFQSNALVSNQDIKMWVNQADTVYVDDVSLTKGWDMNIVGFVKGTYQGATITTFLDYGIAGSITTSRISFFKSGGDNYWRTQIYDNAQTGTVFSNTITAYSPNSYQLPNLTYNRLDSLRSNISGVNSTAGSIKEIGKHNGGTTLTIGYKTPTATTLSYWTGTIGHIQITKFTDISQSNVNSTTLTTAYNRGKLLQGEWTGGTPIEVAFYDWKGADATEMLRDKSGTGNNLTGTNIDITDRVKVKGKFK